MKLKLLISSAIILFLIASFSGCIDDIPNIVSDIIYVDDDGGQDFTTIQNAIDNASNGSMIYVYNGTYHETLVINKSVDLVGLDNDKTIISYNKSDAGLIIQIYANNCAVKGFKIINTGSSSDVKGINIHSSNNTISNNTISDLDYGINLNEGTKHNNIFWNNISNNQHNIVFYNSNNNNISNNEITFSKGYSSYGIYFKSGANNNVIYRNNISNNDYSIRIKGSQNNEVIRNRIVNNEKGLWFCCGSRSNIVYFNTFMQNSDWNAKGINVNEWDNGSHGNYWDDYNGTDDDGDGIGDIPYDINGDGNPDRFPLMNPVEI